MQTWIEGVEQARRTVEAAAIAAAGAVDRSDPFRGQGFFTAESAVKHMGRLSGPEAHRRVDALLAMARAAASVPPMSRSPRPTVDILMDHESFEARLRGETPDPATYGPSSCVPGRRLHPDDAVNAALIGHIRRVVYGASGTVIDLGRRTRLFRGNSREAVMLLLTTCVWIGCDRPIAWCDADHSLAWKAKAPAVGSGREHHPEH